MSAPLTAGELADMERTLRVMLSPLAHATTAEWARELCDASQALAGEDTHASVYLEGTGRPALVHTNLDEAVTRGYFAHYWTLDAPMREIVARRIPVAHALMVCTPREYYAAPLYHEYIKPSGIDLSVGLSAFDAAGASPRLMITYARPPQALDRTTALLAALRPAFASGVAALARAAAPNAVLRGALEALDGAVLVCDRRGRVLHETAALGRLLAGAGARAGTEVREAAAALAAAVGTLVARRPAAGAGLDALHAAARAVRTPAGVLRLRCTLAPEGALGGEPAVLVVVEPQGPAAPSAPTTGAPAAPPPAGATVAGSDDAALRARYGLTAQECQVARLLAERRTDAEVGAALGISPHTARTHAERVRRKLGVARRTDVAARLGGAS